MLEDRDYMRQPEFGERGWRPRFSFGAPWTMALLGANIVVFLIECILCGYPPLFSRNNYFALSVDGIEHGMVWQLLTFQFMHAGLAHIFFNSWTIFVFGRYLEMELGARRFLSVYFAGGIIGGVAQVVGGILWPLHFGTAVVGASAGAMALVTVFAVLYPEQKLVILLYFFPVVTRAKYIVWGFAILSAVCILLPQSFFSSLLGGNVANGAHLGGMALGWIYVKTILKNRFLVGVPDQEQYFQPSTPEPPAPRRRPVDEFEDEDVDAILDKISARGINSLTSKERAVLEAARKKMARR
jgi:membrane associated rhomboid family serine protease